MPETKTFKNSAIRWGYDALMREYAWCIENEFSFYASDYDMEVTFTRKTKVPKRGDYMRNRVGGFYGTVLGVDEETRYLWVRRDGNSRPETFEDYELWEYV